IRAKRRARQHAGLAVDLVLVESPPRQLALHLFERQGLELLDLSPWRLERARARDAVGEMADEQHVKIGEVIVLKREVVRRREKRRTVRSCRHEYRRFRCELGTRELAIERRRIAALEPFGDLRLHVGLREAAVRILRRTDLVAPALAALPAELGEM